MIKRFLLLFSSLLLGFALMACSEQPKEVEIPVAMQAPDDATGYYCGMLLPEHEGPKGQIHLASRERPIWFTSVHDKIGRASCRERVERAEVGGARKRKTREIEGRRRAGSHSTDD